MRTRYGIDGASEASFLSRQSKPPRTAGSSPRKVDEEAFLSMEQEYRRMKQKELATEEKVRQLTSQLARTEEAAKRMMVRGEASARGGTAQRLLDAERELARAKADKAEVERELERLKRVASDYKRQVGDAKKKLDLALQDQRRLAQKVGKLESARSLGLINQGAPTGGDCIPQPDAQAARQFAQQQEELARAREEVQVLRRAQQEAQAQSEEMRSHAAAAQQRFHNLVQGLESEILALARKLEAYEEQLSALGVPLPGPYGGSCTGGGQSLRAAAGGLDSLPQAMLWVLEEWHHEGQLYLRDLLNNGVYSFQLPVSQGSPAGAGGWPQPVGLCCAGSLLSVPPRQALKLFLTLGEALAGGDAKGLALHQPLLQAAGCTEAASGVLERAVGHSVADSDVAALLACLGTNPASVVQPAAFAASLRGMCQVAASIVDGSCRQLKMVQQKVQQALEQRPEEALRLLLGPGNRGLGAESAVLRYARLVEWLRAAAPGLSSEETWAAVLWLRTWDLHATGAALPADVLHAFRFGAVWHIRAPALAAGAAGVRESLRVARELQQQLGPGGEVERLERALGEREGELQRRAKEVHALKARLEELEAALREAQRAQRAGRALQERQQEAAGLPSQGAGRGGQGSAAEGETALLRLKWLKAKSALDSATACNARLLQELGESQAQLEALRRQKAALAPQPKPCPDHGGGAAGGSMLCTSALQLQHQQQLAEARHQAAQLQVELDAAETKLAIYRSHPVKQQESAGGSYIKAVHPESRCCDQLPQAERVGAKPRTSGSSQAEALGSKGGQAALPPGPPGLNGGSSVAPAGPRYVLEELRGLVPQETVIELRVQGAVLAPRVLGPQGMTCLSLDFYEHETQLTPVLEGPAPQYNTTVQFVAAMDAYLIQHLQQGHLRVELHACRAAPAGGVEYNTTAWGELPLAGLLEERPGGASGQQQCELLDEEGRPCGTVQYMLRALRPISVPALAHSARQTRQTGSLVSGPENHWALEQPGRKLPDSCSLLRPPATASAPPTGAGGWVETTYVCYSRAASPAARPDVG